MGTVSLVSIVAMLGVSGFVILEATVSGAVRPWRFAEMPGRARLANIKSGVDARSASLRGSTGLRDQAPSSKLVWEKGEVRQSGE